jgi:hypothetical protein
MADRALAKLEALADVGLRLAEALERHVLCAERVQVHQADTDPDVMIMPACDLAGVALAYTRVSRAVRMTFALQARLANPGPVRSAGRPGGTRHAPAAAPASRPAPSFEGGDANPYRGFCESTESLADPEDAPDPLEGPAYAIIDQICRDLDLPADQASELQALWAGATEDCGPQAGPPVRAPGDQTCRRGAPPWPTFADPLPGDLVLRSRSDSS